MLPIRQTARLFIKECKEMIQALHSAGFSVCDGDAVYCMPQRKILLKSRFRGFITD